MCKPSEYSIQTKEGKNECVRCEECPPGMELTHSCGNRTPYPADVKIECIECKNGTFSIDQSSKACRQCSPECAKNEEERDKCLPTQNRFCKCRSGLYRDTGTNKCTKECCYCEQSDIEVEDCANREDGRVSKFCILDKTVVLSGMTQTFLLNILQPHAPLLKLALHFDK